MNPSEANKRATVKNGVSAAPAILSAAQLAAGGAAVSGAMEPFAGLANYAVMWYAQRAEDHHTNHRRHGAHEAGQECLNHPSISSAVVAKPGVHDQ